MKLIYKAKWVIVILFAIVFAASFVVLFVGGTAGVNRCLLVMNVLLIIAQSANMVYAIRNRYKGVGVVLLGCLIISIAFIISKYRRGWYYKVKSLKVGF